MPPADGGREARERHLPTWWLRREAQRLGVPFERLEHAARVYGRLQYRMQDKDYCECCDALLVNRRLEHEDVREVGGSDEDGNLYCVPCADGLREAFPDDDAF